MGSPWRSRSRDGGGEVEVEAVERRAVDLDRESE